MITEALRTYVMQALSALGIDDTNVHLEHPEDAINGDYSTNVAMAHAKTLGVSPKELAEKIIAELLKNKSQYVEEIKVAGPGFINFYLTPSYFNTELLRIISEKDYGASDIYKGKKILIEHSSPNLFKPFHIGHVMNNAIGESVSRLAKYSGADVTVISYPSDVSLGIGKAVWALMQDGKEKLEQFKTESEQLAYLGDCYVRGTKALEDDPTLLPVVQDITKKIYEHIPSPELDLYEIGKKINLDYFTMITAKLGSHFDNYIYESEAGEEGKKIVEENVGKVFEKSDGAVIYAGEQDGLHTRVFINKEGYPTYEAKDVGLLSLKFKRYSPDLSLFVTDHQQAEYFKVVVSAAGKINPMWKDRTTHLTHGRMSFKGQKMSSRLGGVPIAGDILEVLLSEVAEYTKDRTNVDTGENAEAVAIAALKFSILRAGLGKNINFDPDTSLSFEGDSGPYLQYTAVRAGSILSKAEALGALPVINPAAPRTLLSRELARFSEVVAHAITSWEPHHLTTYLLSVAQAFNSWYATTRIVEKDNPEMPHHLALTKATSDVIEKGLYLLGIQVPEKM